MTVDRQEPAELESRFDRLLAERLGPTLQGLTAKRRRALLVAGAVCLAVFAVTLLLSWGMFASLGQALGGMDAGLRAVSILLPATFAVIAFSLAYIILLHRVASEFRRGLRGAMVEFIGAGASETSAPASMPFPPGGILFTDRDVRAAPSLSGATADGRWEAGEIRLRDGSAGGKRQAGCYWLLRYSDTVDGATAIVREHPALGGAVATEKDAGGAPVRKLETAGGGEFAIWTSDPDAAKRLLAKQETAAAIAYTVRTGRLPVLSLAGDGLFFAALSESGVAGKRVDDLDLPACREHAVQTRLFLRAAEAISPRAENNDLRLQETS